MGPAALRVIGVLGRAQRLYGVRCSCVAFASNHWHGLLQVDDALLQSSDTLSAFGVRLTDERLG